MGRNSIDILGLCHPFGGCFGTSVAIGALFAGRSGRARSSTTAIALASPLILRLAVDDLTQEVTRGKLADLRGRCCSPSASSAGCSGS